MKKECGRFRLILNRSHDSEVSPREKEILEKHLEACADCREEAALLDQVSLFLKSGKRLRASSGFTDGVMRGIERETSLTPWNAVLPLVKRMAVAAAIIMMISFSFLAFHGKGNKQAPAGTRWDGATLASREEVWLESIFLGEGLTPENARKIVADSER